MMKAYTNGKIYTVNENRDWAEAVVIDGSKIAYVGDNAGVEAFIAGKDAEVMAKYGPLVYGDQTSMLNKMGQEGWELVNTYTEIATAFPNFGNSEYVTGLRENVRTSVINFVFKRPSDGKQEVLPEKVEVKKENKEEKTNE
jgi:hypothetical protein